MAANTERQLVSFNLEEEKFGMDIMDVQEIIKIPEITKVPKAPQFVEGVINLRGRYRNSHLRYPGANSIKWRINGSHNF